MRSRENAYHIQFVSAELVVHPGRVIGWDEFTGNPKEYPPNSIALDGYVDGPPARLETPFGHYANFDHHRGTPRLETLSTAQQILRHIRLRGLVEAFTRRREFHATMYANHPDQDVALSVYLLQHAPDIAAASVTRGNVALGTPLRNLVDMAGDLDATAGMYPYDPTMPLMEEIAWMFRPYTERATSGQGNTLDVFESRDIIHECCSRIGLYLAGRGERQVLDTRYTVIGKGKNWTMFTEDGPEGRIGAFHDGVRAFIIYKGQREDGNHDYSIGRASDYMPFDVIDLVTHLNEVEGCLPNAGWGCDGDGIIGGSPRRLGSTLDPVALRQLVNNRLREQERMRAAKMRAMRAGAIALS